MIKIKGLVWDRSNRYEFRQRLPLTVGISFSGKILVVCHTFRQIEPEFTKIRIISSRKATKQERKQYME